MIFQDRQDAGRQLAEALGKYKSKDTLVIAIPRGGVPVGYQIARGLGVPLDVMPVRKIGSPFNREYGIGAVAPGDVLYVDRLVIKRLGIKPRKVAEIAEEEIRELERRERLYRSGKKPLGLTDKVVILTDDGLATGVTAKAAVLAIKKQKPKKVILAVPGCPTDTADQLRDMVDEFISFEIQDDFRAVGNLYIYFPQISDEEVVKILQGK